MNRRDLLQSGSAAAAAAMAGAVPRRARAQAQAIKLGFLGPLSGGMEVMGRPLLTGAEIAVNQINQAGGVGGRKLELVQRDDKGTGKDAVAAAQDLFGSGVNLLLGNISTASVLGVSPILSQSNAVLISCSAVADSLTHEAFTPNYFRVCENAYTKYRAQARLFAERMPETTRWTGVVTDAANGASIWTAFSHGLREFYPALAKKPVTIIDPVIVKVGANDYKQQIARLMATPAQSFLNCTNGADAILFFSQSASVGMDSRFPLVADAGSGWGVPAALKNRVPPSMLMGVFWYYEAYKNLPMGAALYKDYVAATGKAFPDDFVELSHAAVYAYANAIKMTGGTDTQPIVDAMAGMQWDTAKGKRMFRKEDHQCIGDVTFLKIDRADNDRGWVVSDFIKVNGVDSIEPPSPGKAIDF